MELSDTLGDIQVANGSLPGVVFIEQSGCNQYVDSPEIRIISNNVGCVETKCADVVVRSVSGHCIAKFLFGSAARARVFADSLAAAIAEKIPRPSAR